METLQPDIFISYNNEDTAKYIQVWKKIQAKDQKDNQVPNIGRDIGPFLTEFAHGLESKYEFYGHIIPRK